MRKLSITILLITLSIAVGCGANFNKASYQALGTMAITYDTALKSANDLYQKGLISEEGKQKIITAANAYRNAHNESVSAFQAYLTASPTEQDEKKLQFITLSRVSLAAYSEMLAALTASGVYGEPVKPWF
jgi:hypothetical protein